MEIDGNRDYEQRGGGVEGKFEIFEDPNTLFVFRLKCKKELTVTIPSSCAAWYPNSPAGSDFVNHHPSLWERIRRRNGPSYDGPKGTDK